MKYLYQALIKIIDNIIYSLTRLLCLKSPPQESKSILLIRLDAIGDFVLWLTSAHLYKIYYPEFKIIVIVNENLASLARSSNYFDEVIDINVRKFNLNIFYRIKILLFLSKLHFSKVIESTRSRVYLTGDTVARFCNSEEKVAALGDIDNIKYSDMLRSNNWYSNLIDTGSEAIHEMDFNINFIRVISKKLGNFQMNSLASELKNGSSDYAVGGIVIVPGASWAGKEWPAKKFVQLIDEIYVKNNGIDVILCGDFKDREKCEYIRSKSINLNIINKAGKTTLHEFISIIEKSSLLIGNDSSAVHIASSVKTKSIVILGGGHFGKFHPYPKNLEYRFKPVPIFKKMDCYGCNWNCTNQNKSSNRALPCISEVEVCEVLEVVLRELKSCP